MILTNAKLKLRGQLMTKIYIICDLEGTAGVVDHRQQCWFDGKYYEQARRLATLELNALVEGALQGGATEIAAWDGHGPFPGGIDVELLHPACRLVMGAGDAGPTGYEGFDAIITLGAVIRGATPHFDYVSNEVAKGVANIGIQSEVPVIFGVLTTDSIEQAIERAGTKAGNKGWDAAVSAIEMGNLYKRLEK